ncbi:hypothetical protein [Caenimonas sp. SL110]|uniref:hypothetical protein n=1 Tax=Caenimonas sp. SL110 TaxID=1450524 RepID=UPI000653BE32|nr:hypothetical protein [Caenimonas sp. SL110]
MQIELIGGDYGDGGGYAIPNFYDPGQGGGGLGGLDGGSPWDYVSEVWTPSIELYSGDDWSGNFYAVETVAPADRDVVAGDLGSFLVREIGFELLKEGGKMYWNWLIKDGAPVQNNNGVNWELSPIFTQGA